MFSVVICERGGTERKETFDKGEISLGRVQGNDLLLTKSNVSKYHARLLYRDERFVVTDLKSTNGTYVNGRKIVQATVVHEGDKVYVGDYVLRVETGRPSAPPIRRGGRGGEMKERADSAGHGVAGRNASALATTIGRSSVPPSSSIPPPSTGRTRMVPPRIPGPPRVPQRTEPRLETESRSEPPFRSTSRPPSSAPPSSAPPPVPSRSSTLPPPPPTRSTPPTPARVGTVPPPEDAARQRDIVALVDRVARSIDLSVLDVEPTVSPELAANLERVVREQAVAMQREFRMSKDGDLERLSRDVLRELVGVGPFEVLLADESVVDIFLASHDRLLVEKSNHQVVPVVPTFSGQAAVARAVSRLVHQTGDPLREGEVTIERHLQNGSLLLAFAPPMANAWAVTIRKRREVELSMEELVRNGALAKSISTFLESCVEANVNVLVVGSDRGHVAGVLSALARAIPAGQRVVAIQDSEWIGIGLAQAVRIVVSERSEQTLRSVRAVSRLGADRLIVMSLTCSMGAATVEAIGEGTAGVTAGLIAPSLRQGLARLTSQIALSRPGTPVDVARQAIADAFDVVVEIASPDGMLRVLRIAELMGTDDRGIATRDLFVYRPDANGAVGESAYAVTGTSPRFSSEVVARGARLDPTLFRRK